METVPDELVLEIFLVSPLRALLTLCQVSQRFLSFSHDEMLWRSRVEREFNLIKDKYEGMTFREQYISLLRIPSAVDARLDQWKALEQRGVHPLPNIIDVIEDPKVIQWMRAKGFPEQDLPPPLSDRPLTEVEKIVQTDSVEQVGAWFREGYNGTLSEHLVTFILASNRVELMEWAVEKFGVEALKRRVEGCWSLVAFQWLYRKYNHLPGPATIDTAARHRKWDIFLWLESLGYKPRGGIAGVALAQNNLEMLKHCFARGNTLNVLSLKVAVSNGYIEALEWLAHRGILPLQIDIEYPGMHHQIDLKEWYLRNGGVWFTPKEDEMETVY